MDVAIRAVLGGLVTALIYLASKRGNVLPGILPLFPTFGVFALLVVGGKGNLEGFKTACMAGARTIPAYLIFLSLCYLLIDRVDYRLAIMGGLAGWLVVALLIFLSPRIF